MYVVAPSPFAKVTPIEVTNALQQNQSILVSLAVNMNPSSQQYYTENGNRGSSTRFVKFSNSPNTNSECSNLLN